MTISKITHEELKEPSTSKITKEVLEDMRGEGLLMGTDKHIKYIEVIDGNSFLFDIQKKKSDDNPSYEPSKTDGYMNGYVVVHENVRGFTNYNDINFFARKVNADIPELTFGESVEYFGEKFWVFGFDIYHTNSKKIHGTRKQCIKACQKIVKFLTDEKYNMSMYFINAERLIFLDKVNKLLQSSGMPLKDRISKNSRTLYDMFW